MIFIVSGFSGAGKSELIKAIPDELNTELILSYTTRAKRNGSDNYHFVDKDTFKAMVNRGAFVETMEYNDNFYGTPKEDLLLALQNGKTPVLDIDFRGARSIINSRLFPREDIVSIFVAADAEELHHRLTHRGTETPATIQKRLNAALVESEVVNTDLYDVALLNHNLDEPKRRFVSIIQGKHCESQHFDDMIFRRNIRDIIRMFTVSSKPISHEPE